ncbi:hypothetical protein [Promicromonospora kroppenstedtii]|uniref:hypothetical protein n=1 Tax=Promicromonospora kroppenstedtii TaxID=440482 RepID=UPI00055A8B91|nr:hypothetical protein [Promicromonospora kroppenstedtii]
MKNAFFRSVVVVTTSIAMMLGVGSQAVALSDNRPEGPGLAYSTEQPEIGILALQCSESSGRGNPGGVPYAYFARSTCYIERTSDAYVFRVKFKCSGESSYRYGPEVAAVRTSRSSTGWCPYPKTITSVTTASEYVGA